MAKLKLNRNVLIGIIGVLFVMSIMPGEGLKAENQQAIVETKYTCSIDEDCPTCVGGGLIKYNETDPSFFGELSHADCLGATETTKGVCYLSDSCLIWNCKESKLLNETLGEIPCKSVRQTILDNTIAKINQSPGVLIGLIIFLVAFFMLKE